MKDFNGNSDFDSFLWEGTYSPKAMAGSCAIGLIVTGLLFFAVWFIRDLRQQPIIWFYVTLLTGLQWVYIVGLALYRMLANDYSLTSQTLRHREGLLFRRMDRMELIDIDDVLFYQGPIQKVMNTGDIVIETSDKSHPQLVIYGISGAAEVVELIDENRRRERRRRGIQINN